MSSSPSRDWSRSVRAGPTRSPLRGPCWKIPSSTLRASCASPSRSPRISASTPTTRSSSRRWNSAAGFSMSSMTPQEIVHELDKHIVGQARAKRAVAIALRNRWRRQQVAEPLRQEITPKNILMIGPTGVGKTEIARRLARLADAPFIQVEATKFTEVGYVGRDVDTSVRDLVEISVKQTREQAMKRVRTRAQEAAEERILDVLIPTARGVGFQESSGEESATRQKFRKRLREGELDDKEIDIEVAATSPQMEILAPPGMEELTAQIQGMMSNMGGGRRRLRRMKIREAEQALTEEEAARLVNDDELKSRALTNAEQNGIVFLDEIDKITSRSEIGR